MQLTELFICVCVCGGGGGGARDMSVSMSECVYTTTNAWSQTTRIIINGATSEL